MGLIWGLTLILYLAFCCELLHQNYGEGWLFYCQAQVRSPKVQSPKVKTKGTWADTKITQVDSKIEDVG